MSRFPLTRTAAQASMLALCMFCNDGALATSNHSATVTAGKGSD
ncbi:hypothetical protein [Litchfieldella qijiaojingensis]|nr:hypothetical protein [Halomonas qijiaojingensis]